MARLSVFLVSLLASAALLACVHRSAADGDCGGSLPQLIAKCAQFVQIPGPPTDPSKDCCAVVQGVDVPCLCSHVTKAVEKIISMEKVCYVAGKCGRPLAHGLKCGTYTVPALA